MQSEAAEVMPEFRPGVDNFFFALSPEGDAGAHAIRIQQENLPLLGWNPYLVPESCLHVSLLDIGIRKNLTLRSIDSTLAMAKSVADGLSFDAFDVSFDCAMSFNPKSTAKKAFVLKMGAGRQQVDALCKQLGHGLALVNVKSEDKATTPHMTLARSVQTIPVASVPPVRWKVTQLVLIHSVVGETRHVLLKRWALQQP